MLCIRYFEQESCFSSVDYLRWKQQWSAAASRVISNEMPRGVHRISPRKTEVPRNHASIRLNQPNNEVKLRGSIASHIITHNNGLPQTICSPCPAR